MRTLNNLAVANGNPNRATDNNNLLLNNRSSIVRLRSVTNNSCNSSNNNWQLRQIKHRFNPGNRLLISINNSSNTSINYWIFGSKVADRSSGTRVTINAGTTIRPIANIATRKTTV